MKAGLMEIADLIVVNKADRPGAENISLSIEAMLDRRRGRMEWKPPVILTSASLDRGIDDLYEEIWRHSRYLKQDDKLKNRRKTQLKDELKQRIESEILNVLWQKIHGNAVINDLMDDIWEQRIDPQTAASKVVRNWLKD